MTAEHSGGDEHWDRFVKDFEASRATPAQTAGPPAAGGPPVEKARRRRGGRTVLVLAVIAGLAGGGYWFGPWRHAGAHAVARPAASTSASTAPVAAARVAAARPLTALTPDQAFPAAVGDYLKVRQAPVATCTEKPAVEATLAGLVTQSQGCLGMSFALYTDEAKDQYTVAVLTMKDPADVATILTTLAADPSSIQIGLVIPSAASGLRHLPATSGLVQQFGGAGHLVVIGVAQWSDGRSGDYQKLEDRLTPLFSAVVKQAESDDPR